MSYLVYKNWKQAEEYYKEFANGSNEDYIEDKIYVNIKGCFNGIYAVAKFNKALRFDLKGNWALLRKHDYTAVLENINQWLQKADDRFNGETWTEKVQVPKPTGKRITGKENLQKYLDILTDGDNWGLGLIERDDGVKYALPCDVEFEIDDEDYVCINFNLPKYSYPHYKQGLKRAITELLVEEGVTNFKVVESIGEIRFYQ